MYNLGKMTELAHFHLAAAVKPGAKVVDATAGNGLDTCFLAKLVGPRGRVIAFDIQREALRSTASRLKAEGLRERVELVLAGHEKLVEYIKEPLAAVVYNLGYLPGGDKDITTLRDTTINSVRQALGLLMPGGLLSAMLYPGHKGGREEAEAVLGFFRVLDPGVFSVNLVQALNRINDPPVLILAQKNR